MASLSASEVDTINALNIVVSSISLLASLALIVIYRVWLTRLRTFAYELVFWMAVSEAAFAISNLMGSPTDGSGLCYFQAGLQSFALLAVILWNVSISYVLRNAILQPKKLLGIAARQTTFHLYNWGVPLVLTLLPAATLSYGNTGGWCWIKNTRAGGFWRFFQLYLPLWFVMGYNIDTVLSVRKKAMAVQNSLSSEGIVLRDTLFYFPLILVICWIPGSILRFDNLVDPNHPKAWQYYLTVIFGNSIGLWHAIAYSFTPPVRRALRNLRFDGSIVDQTMLNTSAAQSPSSGAGAASFDVDATYGSASAEISDSKTGAMTGREFDAAASPHSVDEKNMNETSKLTTQSIQSSASPSGIRAIYLYDLGIYQLIGLESKQKSAGGSRQNRTESLEVASNIYGVLKESDDSKIQNAKSAENGAVVVVDQDNDAIYHRKTSYRGAYLTLMKSFVGIGILAIPGAYKEAGYALGTFGMLAISLVSYYCIVLLIRTKNGIVSELRAKRPAQAEAGAPNPPISSSMSFQEIGFHTFGPRGQRFVEVSIVVLQLSFVAAYVVFIGTTFGLVFNQTKYKILFCVIATVAVVPLVYLRSIAVLVIPAVIADVIIVIGISMVLVYDVIQIDTVSETIKGADPGGFPLFFGIAVFAFEGINMALPVEQSMTNPEEFKDVLQSVFIHLTVLLVLVGALSYSAYGNDTEDIIFLNLPQNWAVKTVQIFYAIALFFSIPVQMFPAIAILESFPYFGSVFRENIYIHRFLVMLVVGLIASVVPNFGLFVNLCGALGGATLAFCLPSVFYMRKSGTSWKPTFAIGFGIIGGITAMVVTIIQFAEGAGGD